VRIGVLSDTHIPEAGDDLPAAAYAALAGSDLILHCGDLHSLVVVDRLERIAPVFAARGNGDTYYPVPPKRPGVPEDPRVQETHVLELEGFRIGLTHDLEDAEGRPEAFAEQLVERVFGERVDLALCGHTHVPLAWGLPGGIAILNPGSPTLPYGYTHVIGTVAQLDLRPGAFTFTVYNLLTGEVDISLAGPGTVARHQGKRPHYR
jgi:putative phosphoesterase